jgi:hypothetical protein
MQSNEIKKFLLKAKNGTYASQNSNAYVAPLVPSSVQLEFREGDLIYRDIFFGMTCFAGQEIVYNSQNVIWSMCYSGGICNQDDNEKAEIIYTFLRHAMLQIPVDLPVRGPEKYEENDMMYICKINGTFDSFNGSEEIIKGEKCLFQLHFSGGSIY